MEITDKKIALLIDGDNIKSAEHIDFLIEKVNGYGTVVIKRVYGDFTHPTNKPWNDIAFEHAILPVQQYAIKGKNSTDSSMIIDAMEILFSNKINCICLATGDRDFIRLVLKLKEAECFVIGAGKEENTNDFFKKACSDFINLSEANITPIEEIIKFVTNVIISSKNATDGWTSFPKAMDELRKKYPKFKSENYGNFSTPTLLFKKLKDNFEYKSNNIRIKKDM